MTRTKSSRGQTRRATSRWWHRNVARQQYALQGWKRERVYPDFIFAINASGDTQRIAVIETKGEHLVGNDDSEYKRSLLQTLSEYFQDDHAAVAAQSVGILELPGAGPPTVTCEMITFSNWQTELPRIIHPESMPRGRRTSNPEKPYPVRHLTRRKHWKNGFQFPDESK